MPLRIDTKAVHEVNVEGAIVLVKTLTGRERLKVIDYTGQVAALIAAKEEEDDVPISVAVQIQGLNFEILKLGLSEDPDLIDPRQWPGLVREVLAANELTRADRGNSPSP